MGRAALLGALCVGSLVASAGATGDQISPMESVVNLIKKLQTQTIAEGKAEAANYDKFACFCKEQADGKLYAITNAGDKIELLTSQIEELNGAITNLNKNIQKENQDLEDLNAECKSEQAARDKAFADYKVMAD